jgi:ribosomal-protein-alanine N-acetyltransferase
MSFSIKRAAFPDIDPVKKIELELDLSCWAKDDYIKELSRPDSVFLVIKNDSEIAGFLLARLIMNSQNSFLEIYNIGIKTSYKRRGLGSLLISKLLEIAKEKLATEIFLEVRKSNCTAIDFYKRNDFEEIGTRKNFYSTPIEDAILMRLNLIN